MDVSFVPGIPDSDIVISVRPGHLEHTEAALFKYLHAIAFYGNLAVGFTCPGFKQLFRFRISYDNDVQGLCGPEIADGHASVRSRRRVFFWVVDSFGHQAWPGIRHPKQKILRRVAGLVPR